MIRLEGNDRIVILLCVGVITICSVLLYLEYNKKYDSKEEAIGTIVYRNRIAQRRNSSSVVWENVDQMDPVYNKDSIRTDDSAEAIITLKDNVKIELDPFSMIVLNIRDEKTEIELVRGSVIIDPPRERKNIEVKQSDKIISGFDRGLRLFLNQKNELELVPESQTKVTVNGNESSVSPGKITLIKDGKLKSEKIAILLQKPADNSRFFTDSPDIPVLFEWGSAGKKPEIEISHDPFFEKENVLKQFLDAKRNILISLKEGSYFWRIKSEIGMSSVRRLRIKKKEPISILSPKNESKFSFPENSPGRIYFSWKDIELAVKYQIEVAVDAKFENISEDRSVNRRGISLTFPPGKYYWRLSVRGGIPGTESVSAVRSFSVAEEKKITEPEKIVPDENRKISGEPEKISLISPKNNAIIDMSKNDFVFFRWSENRNATEYTFRLFLDTSKRKLLHEEKLKTNDLKFSDLSKLDKGNFSWEVEAKIKSPEGEMKSISGSGKFRIILSEDLKSPEFQTQ